MALYDDILENKNKKVNSANVKENKVFGNTAPVNNYEHTIYPYEDYANEVNNTLNTRWDNNMKPSQYVDQDIQGAGMILETEDEPITHQCEINTSGDNYGHISDPTGIPIVTTKDITCRTSFFSIDLGVKVYQGDDWYFPIVQHALNGGCIQCNNNVGCEKCNACYNTIYTSSECQQCNNSCTNGCAEGCTTAQVAGCLECRGGCNNTCQNHQNGLDDGCKAYVSIECYQSVSCQGSIGALGGCGKGVVTCANNNANIPGTTRPCSSQNVDYEACKNVTSWVVCKGNCNAGEYSGPNDCDNAIEILNDPICNDCNSCTVCDGCVTSCDTTCTSCDSCDGCVGCNGGCANCVGCTSVCVNCDSVCASGCQGTCVSCVSTCVDSQHCTSNCFSGGVSSCSYCRDNTGCSGCVKGCHHTCVGKRAE
jgi:hypothetical protein